MTTVKPFAERDQKPGSRRTISGLAATCGVDEEVMHILYGAFRDLDEKRNIATDGWGRRGRTVEEDVPPERYEYAVAQG